jgi:hypothetical protein
VLKLGLFGKYLKNTCEVSKCAAGEGWSRAVGRIVWEMKKYCMESGGRGISCVQ